MMMPSATINSKTYKSAIGIVMSAANVAAKMIPADEMTPPVLRKATSRASLMFRFFPLFQKATHEYDIDDHRGKYRTAGKQDRFCR